MTRKLMEHELCVITGASSGIARGIAERFLEEGADLIVADYDVETAQKIYGENPQVVDILKVDATKVEDLEKIAEAVKKTGRRVKAVLPIVGNGPTNMIPDVTPQEFHLTMDLNVFSAFFTVQKVLPYMAEKSAIVLISSIAGFQGGSNNIVYNAAKAAVRSMARSFAGELACKGIRANAIAPGFIITDMTAGLPEEVKTEWAKKIPLRRGGTPEDVANIATFLASDMSSYVSGQVIQVDGGMNM